MTKLIYAGYLLLTTIGLGIVVQLVWGWVMHRRVRISPMIWLLVMVGAVAGVYLWQQQQLYPMVAAERRTMSEEPVGPLQVAAVWPAEDPTFFEGARRAVADINAAGGVTLMDESGEESRHPIALVEYPNERGDDTYRDVAENRTTLAVIGHSGSREAVRASVVYDESGLLFIVPSVTVPALTNYGHPRLIRIVPDDAILAGHLRDLLRDRGLTRVAVLHVRTLEGETLARYLARAFTVVPDNPARVDVPKVVMTRSYPPEQDHFHELITELIGVRPDAIAIADGLPRAADLIREIRQRGMTQPILGTPALEEARLFTIADRFSDDVFIPSLLPPDLGKNGLDSFAEAQAYEAVRLLAAAWERTGSAEPGATAATLRGLPAWPGLRGVYDFKPNGDVAGWSLIMKRSQDRRFLPLRVTPARAPGDDSMPAADPPTETRG
jgi:branched-chain amino acid transport system substrate-binding protein